MNERRRSINRADFYTLTRWVEEHSMNGIFSHPDLGRTTFVALGKLASGDPGLKLDVGPTTAQMAMEAAGIKFEPRAPRPPTKTAQIAALEERLERLEYEFSLFFKTQPAQR